MIKIQRELVDVIREAESRPLVHQPLPTHTVSGVLIDYKPICYFHAHDEDLISRYGKMFVHLDDRVFRSHLTCHDISKEDIDGKQRIIRYGICRPCAEGRKLIPVDEDGEAYLS
ncbi:MAG: hypothetical protein AAB613_00800 [Patescibacteria group bacterium]